MAAQQLILAVLLLVTGSLSFHISSFSTRAVQRPAVTMKVFDWQRREAFESFTIPDGASTSRLLRLGGCLWDWWSRIKRHPQTSLAPTLAATGSFFSHLAPAPLPYSHALHTQTMYSL